MNQPLVSIIITTYRALEYLQLCVESLLRQMPDNYQIIIYADGSPAETRAYLESLKQQNIKWRYELENVGITKALNRATEMADGKWLYFVNDDMVFAPKFAENLEKHLSAKRVLTGTVIEPELPNMGIAKCHICHDYGLNRDNFDLQDFDNTVLQLAEDRTEPGINYPFLIETSLLAEIGGFDERFAGPVHDPDLFYRIALAGAEMLRVRDSLCYHFSGRSLRFSDGGSQVSRQWIEQEMAGKIAFLDKWGERQHYRFGGVPHPVHTVPDQRWPLPVRVKLALLKGKYHRRAKQALERERA